MRKCVGEVIQVVGEVTQVVGEMKQFCWGSDTKSVGEMPQIQSDTNGDGGGGSDNNGDPLTLYEIVQQWWAAWWCRGCEWQRCGGAGEGSASQRKVFETLKSSISLKVFKVCWC